MKKTNHLSTFGIIKSAMGIPLKSYDFVILTFLAALPLFLVDQTSRLFLSYFSETPSSPKQLPLYPKNLMFIIKVLSWIIGFLCSLVFISVQFLVAITTINSASMIYNTGRSTSLRILLGHAITKTKWMGSFVTFAIMSALSVLSFEAALYWLRVFPLVRSRYIFLDAVHASVFALAMIKWWEYTVLWKVGVLVSSFEEKVGFKAFSVSADLIKGNRLRGLSLTLVFVVWQVFVFPFLLKREILSGKIVNGVFSGSSVCVETVILWLFYVVYYHDCKIRYKGKKEVEGGRFEIV